MDCCYSIPQRLILIISFMKKNNRFKKLPGHKIRLKIDARKLLVYASTIQDDRFYTCREFLSAY